MTEDTTIETRTLIDAAAEHLPQPFLLHTEQDADSQATAMYQALPPGWKMERIDTEKDQPRPRALKARASLDNADSFLAYVLRFADGRSQVWCRHSPVNNALSFQAVMDDHAPGEASWRTHTATFTPELSVEWQRWLSQNEKPMKQVEFALWLESNLRDVYESDDERLPTGSQILAMALDFEARSEMRVKSHARLQSGAVRLEYVNDDDDQTIQRMEVFDRFALSLPVFRSGARFVVQAKLRYRVTSGAVSFWYELQRPDLTHTAAAEDLIEQIKQGLSAAESAPPLFMGASA